MPTINLPRTSEKKIPTHLSMKKMGQEKNSFLCEHYNRLALERLHWHKKNSYYHSEMLRYFRFLIPDSSSVLEIDCQSGDVIGNLKTSRGVGVTYADKMADIARQKYPEVNFVATNLEDFQTRETFDYVLISDVIGVFDNIQGFLQKLLEMTTSDTRVIISYYNELWAPILWLAEKLKLKMPEIHYNWLSVDDIENFLAISGYEVIRRDYVMLLPVSIPLLTPFLNRFVAKFPIIRRLTCTHCVVARPLKPPVDAQNLTASVILTCRDEEENIQELVEGIPQMGRHTEIIFVEGHSKDRTVEKIQEMIKKYPEKDIKLLKQKGIGQGDAFRMGFDQAKGDLLCWLEADLTVPPQEIAFFWDTFVSGKGEYINGTRFIYKMEEKSMPLKNFLGNRFFGNVFSTLLGQRFTDTLCGFKAISRRNYQKIKKQMDYFGDFDPFGDFQLIFGAIKNSLKVAEIPVHYRPRQYGASKAYGKSLFSFLKHAWLLLRMSWIAFKKFKLF